MVADKGTQCRVQLSHGTQLQETCCESIMVELYVSECINLGEIIIIMKFTINLMNYRSPESDEGTAVPPPGRGDSTDNG